MLCLTACKSEEPVNEIQVEVETIEQVQTDKVEEAPTATADVKKNLKNIRVATTGQLNTGVIKLMEEQLEYYGYQVEVVECQDYDMVMNNVTTSQADMALGINQVMMDSYNMRNASDLVICERVYISPFVIYGGSVMDLNNIPNNTKVYVETGDVNVARALHLLSQKGLLTLKEDCGYQTSKEDILSNPKNLEIVEVNIKESLDSGYGLIICDYNKGIMSGLNPQNVLATENRNSELMDLFAISVITKSDKTDFEGLKTFIKVINSDEVEKLINDNYKDSLVDYR